MLNRTRLLPFALPLLLAACASVPDGPRIIALPGTGKASQEFNADEAHCRESALQQSGGKSANDAAVDSGVRSAALGTLIGAAAGALMGGHHSTEAGASAGLLFGALLGTEAADRSAYTIQQRYDVAYAQCMYDNGHRVPVSGRLVVERHRTPPPPNIPPPNTAPPPMASQPPPVSGTLFVYPKSGQSDAQIAEDRRHCSAWASTQTGFDPVRDSPTDVRHSDFKRATSACLESRGYAVK